jgi:hypothetical protein
VLDLPWHTALSDTFLVFSTRPATDANMTRLHDDKGPQESLALLPHELSDSLNQGLTSITGEADQDNTGRVGMTDEDQQPKSLSSVSRMRLSRLA